MSEGTPGYLEGDFVQNYCPCGNAATRTYDSGVIVAPWAKTKKVPKDPLPKLVDLSKKDSYICKCGFKWLYHLSVDLDLLR